MLSQVYFVLELCKGGELFDAIVERGTFSEVRSSLRRILHCLTACALTSK